MTRILLLGVVLVFAAGCSNSSAPSAGEPKPLVGERIPPGAGPKAK